MKTAIEDKQNDNYPAKTFISVILQNKMDSRYTDKPIGKMFTVVNNVLLEKSIFKYSKQ